jgi:hypothetical protein
MAAGAVLAVGLSSVICCASPVYLYLKPDKKMITDGEGTDGEKELQMLRNQVSAYDKEDEAQQAIFDQGAENEAEDMSDLLSLRRRKNYYEDRRSTPCTANIHDLAMKVDCGRNSVKQFKLTSCNGGLYKYDYTCLGGIDAKVFDDTQKTQIVNKASLGDKIMDAKIDMRTMYRHNVRCDLGGIGKGRGRDGSTEMDTFGETPISQFRYDYIVNPSNDYENTTQYLYKCLAAPTSGQCQNYETTSGALKPEDLVTDGAMGLQGMDVKCPGDNQVLTRFQLKAGATAEDGTVIPPFPAPGGKSVYRYDYTCCKMET